MEKTITRVKEEHPLAYSELVKFVWEDVVSNWNLRDLFDFFDYHNININVTYEGPTYRAWSVDSLGNYLLSIRHFSRVEAEIRAFEKAFEVLEKRLGDEYMEHLEEIDGHINY